MEYGNTAVVFMVIGVVTCVLGLVFLAISRLNKAVDRNAH
jgi:hypothetical protein